MQFDANTPRKERTIAGITVQVIQPFAEGQVLTEATAAILNQTIAENFSNNLRATLEKGVLDADGNKTADHTSETAQPLVDAYMAEYEPGVRRGGSGEPRVTDPVEKEARKIAREKASELIKSRGLKAKDVNMVEIAGKIFDKHRDALMAAAKKIVDARAKAEAANEFDLSDI